MSHEPEDPQPTHRLVMPFVTVSSNGGPHDDDSYVAGFEMGHLDADLLAAAGVIARVEGAIQTVNRPQADLIAMHRGWTATFTDTEVEGWTHAVFERAEGIS
ncbi:hypothetical protein [Nocardia wallacei]|uniref:hypothetical protein n=1 Tax=Nocardia wallacei TaxID=480035 RepID=UPI00245689F6|nr:hypothetical protein [Nocardia wallacei]